MIANGCQSVHSSPTSAFPVVHCIVCLTSVTTNMVNFSLIKAALLGFAVSTLATPTPVDTAPLARRSAINSDVIVGFPQTVPSGSLGALYLKYQPLLYTANGCVPFPAVDAQGNTKYV